MLTKIAGIPDSIYQSFPGGPYFVFELLMRWVLVLLGVYLLLLLIASIRHASSTILVSGASGLFIGLFALTWLSLLIVVVLFLFAVVGWIAWLLRAVIEAIFSVLLWAPVLYTIVGIIGIAISVGVISWARGLSIRRLWEAFQESLRNMSARPFVVLFALAALVAFIWFVGIPLWQYYISPILLFIRDWLAQYVVPIISWIGSLLITLIVALVAISLVLVALGMLGWQFADQFSSARRCGHDSHVPFEAGFATGVVMGLALLVCSANPTFRSLVNASWADTSPILASMDLSAAVYYLMPASAEARLHAAFAHASLPIFDFACLVLVLLLINSSLITGLLSKVTIEPLRELLTLKRLPPLGKILFGFIVACGAVLVESVASEDA